MWGRGINSRSRTSSWSIFELNMCSYWILLVNSIFCCELHFFLNFSCVYSRLCSWGTNYAFLQLLPSKVFITIQVPKWDQFWGVISRSKSIFGLKFYPNLGSTPSLAPVPLMSHLMSWGDQLQIQIQLQTNIWVVTFYLNLGSTPSPAPAPSMSHHS